MTWYDDSEKAAFVDVFWDRQTRLWTILINDKNGNNIKSADYANRKDEAKILATEIAEKMHLPVRGIKVDVCPEKKWFKRNPKRYNATQLEHGIEVEMEHTCDKEVAREIAMDHLDEFPNYYVELAKMEKKLKKQTIFHV